LYWLTCEPASEPFFFFQHGEELMPYSTLLEFFGVQSYWVKVISRRVIIIKGGLAGNI
jgi:hypothetical protein